MHKLFYIPVLLLCFFTGAAAQEKIIYQDTALLQQEEEIQPPAEVESGGGSTTAKTADEEATVETVDTSLYPNNLTLPFDSLMRWKQGKDYAYTQYLDSLLRNRKRQEMKAPQGTAGPGIISRILNSGIVRILMWALVILFVLFVIYRLFLAEALFQRRSKQLNDGEPGEEAEQVTPASDFDALVKGALQNGNYRQAVRYQYLRTLHALAVKNYIELAPDKTNFQYVREITNRGHQNDFAALTLHYEYVWYGEFDIDGSIYRKIENQFITLNQKL